MQGKFQLVDALGQEAPYSGLQKVEFYRRLPELKEAATQQFLPYESTNSYATSADRPIPKRKIVRDSPYSRVAHG